MNAEPQLEELSAYLDHELTGSARQDLESHLAGCETCRRRLEALKETIHAVRALPLETPARTFTIPAQRRQAARWEPAAWIGGLAAAAVLVVAVGLNLPHGGAAPASSAAGLASTKQYGPESANAPAAGAATKADQARRALSQSFLSNRTGVGGGSQGMAIGTDNTAYGPGGTIRVQLVLTGSSLKSTSTTDAGVQLLIVSTNAGTSGPGQTLPPLSGTVRADGTLDFEGAYAIARLGFSQRPVGPYRLIAIWTVPGGAGQVLVTEVPIYLTSS